MNEPDLTTQSCEPGGPLGTTLRVGTVVACRLNEDARSPADVLEIDLGPHGRVTSSARIVDRHTPETLVGRQLVIANDLGTRTIAGVRSEVLVLGAEAASGGVTLIAPEVEVANGARVH